MVFVGAKVGANVGENVGAAVVIPVCEHVVGAGDTGQKGDNGSLLFAYYIHSTRFLM